MKQLFLVILYLFIFSVSLAHTGFGMREHYGKVEVYSFINFEREEFRKAFIIGQLAQKLADKLGYQDSIYMDFYHDHHDAGSSQTVYHLGFDQLPASGEIHKSGGTKLVIRQYSKLYDVEQTLKLLEYGIVNDKRIQKNQKIKNNATFFSSLVQSFLSISDAEINGILQKPSSTSVKEIMQCRIERPQFDSDQKLSISYFWQNNRYHLVRTDAINDENISETDILELPNIYTFHPLYPMTVVFENSKSFYVIHPKWRDHKIGKYIPSKKQTISYMSNTGQGKKITAITNDEVSISFQYERKGISKNPTRILLYSAELDTLIQDLLALNSPPLSNLSYDQISASESIPQVFEHTVSWRKQLDFVKEQGENDNTLKLISYTDMDSSDSITIHDFEDQRVSLTISKIRLNYPESMKKHQYSSKNKEVYLQNSTNVLRRHQLMNDSLKLVKLLWSLRDQKFYTYAIVSINFDTLLFDDIIMNGAPPGKTFMIRNLINHHDTSR